MAYYCVAITGGIGSGKTTAANFFRSFGIEVIDADKVAKGLTQEPPIIKQLTSHFGIAILSKEQQIQRNKLREIIFTDPAEKKWLETLLHPLIRQRLEQAVSQASSPYCMVEIPLLKDKSGYPYINRVLYIKASKAIQVQRASKRDQLSKGTIASIIQQQPSHQERLALADDVLENNETLTSLEQKCYTLHQYYLTKAKMNNGSS